MDFAQDVRRFNRFYTRQIGLLEEHLPASDLSLPEGRVLFEIATEGPRTAAAISRAMGMDKAQLSRLVGRLLERSLLVSEVDPDNARRRILSLTDRGREAFAELDRGSQTKTETMLEALRSEQRRRLVGAMREIEATLAGKDADGDGVTLRPPRPGDIGWITSRQAVLYTQEYGWDWTYEGFVAKILGDFVTGFDPLREDAWIAEGNGRILGSIFLMRSDRPDVARLRLLYVEPDARGLGLGRRLVETCIDRARELGYSRLTLWTNDILTAARHIYENAGFRLTDQTPHRSFGKDLVGQTWDLDL
ncbi:MAG TPA: helix-turn-helix domain-containing GNAT family N-acetyltransferase [Brevundimonas sp.]|nr:helix-turn-helix domain-containing GNAT family N-acetyltransferase [Brevundimonas sp.]